MGELIAVAVVSVLFGAPIYGLYIVGRAAGKAGRNIAVKGSNWAYRELTKPPKPKPVPPPPPPPTREDLLMQLKEEFEEKCGLIDKLPLDDAEKDAAKGELRSIFLHRVDGLLQ